MWKLLPYLKNYKKESIIGPLFKLLEVCFELLVPLIMARIIDVGIKNRDLNYIWKYGAVLLILGMLGLACALTAQYFAAKASVGFGTKIRHDLFRHIGSLSFAEIDKAGSATLVVRMTSDINQVQTGVNLVLRLFLRSPFIVIGAMTMAFRINTKAALILVVVVPLLAIVIYGIMAAAIPLYKKVQKHLDRVLGTVRENLTGIRVIRAFGMQAKEKKTFTEQSHSLVSAQLSVGKLSALMNPMTYLIVNAGIAAIIWCGGIQVNIGHMMQGEVIALLSYMSQILLALIALADLIIAFTKAVASAGRLNEVFALQNSLESRSEDFHTPDCKEETVVFEEVAFYYPDSREPALVNLSFDAKVGETIGIIGGTGSGKSTLVNLIPRFYDAAKGSICVEGKNVKHWELSKLRAKIGIVPQKAVLFHGTIRDNIRMGKEDASDVEIMEALQIAQAYEFVSQKPEGLDTMISEGGRNLSGGQRQRLTIARALVRKPAVLILDDSASALDYATDLKLRKALQENGKDCVVFLISQRASSIRHADRILVLDEGRAVGCGSHEELKEKCSVYKEILDSQLTDQKEVGQYA